MKKKQQIIFGIDEVGRGPLAGPVFAVALTGPAISNFKILISPKESKLPTGQANQTQNPRLRQGFGGQAKSKILKNRDSKKLSPKQREEIYNFLKKDPRVKWGIGRVSGKVIDRINIFEATKMAMIKAVLSLEKEIGHRADLLLIDGNFGIGINRPQESIIKGDEKVPLISLASIVAKVERDRLMVKMHKKYPLYGFAEHKGYGTASHLNNLRQHGPCAIHRKSFVPIKDCEDPRNS